MSLYFEGYQQARDTIATLNEKELLDYLDNLYGRDNLPDDYSMDQLRAEAYTQCQRDFTDTASQEYKDSKFWSRVIQRDSK